MSTHRFKCRNLIHMFIVLDHFRKIIRWSRKWDSFFEKLFPSFLCCIEGLFVKGQFAG